MDAREFFQKVVVPRYFRRRWSRPLPRPLLCPICKSAVQELDRTGDATGFDCETHGKFKVANTVFADVRVRNYTNAQWEVAFAQGKAGNEGGGMAGYKEQ